MSTRRTPQTHFDLWRMWVVYAAAAFIFVFYGLRLYQLQILQGPEYVARAEVNRTDTVNVATKRGIIYDRNGTVLARNVASYHVVITPAYLPSDEGAIQEIYRNISDLTGVPVNNGVINEETVRLFTPCQTDMGITQIVVVGDTNWPYQPIRVSCNIEPKLAMLIRERAVDWPGVDIEVEPVRDYPNGYLTSEIIGFLGPVPALEEEYYKSLGFVPGRDKVGYAGIEAKLQELLGGKNGKRVVEVDVAGKELRNLQPPIDPQPGKNLRLTIDSRLQAATREALIGEITWWNEYLGTVRSQNGVAMAINPKTGEVLSLVSFPNYENNRMARGIPGYYYTQLQNTAFQPLFNHAISAEHPPGSVFKIAASLGILNEGVVTPEKEFIDTGQITMLEKYAPNDPGRPKSFVCHKRDGHGIVNFLTGVKESCDVYFYKVGGGFPGELETGLGIWRLGEYAKALGYGDITGIELPGEQPGLMPDPTWKRLTYGQNWAIGDTYIATIGQGFVTATPIQTLIAMATIANDGKMMRPTLVREVLDEEGNVVKPFEPQLVRDITKDEVIQVYDERNLVVGKRAIEPWVIAKLKEGLRLVVENGTATKVFEGQLDIPSAGKTGTAEYCDNVAASKNLCQPGNWPTHAWYAGYAPYDDPEIAVVAFVYNGGEGSSVAGPIVLKILRAYFELKSIDAASGKPATSQR